MRAFGLAAVALLLAQGAQAQDVLRGSVIETGPRVMSWAGVYGGGQVSYVLGNSNFTGVTRPLVADMLRMTRIEDEMAVSTWPIISSIDAEGSRTAGFGGYVGFNSQWDEIVLGVDATYMRTNYTNAASGTMTRVATLSNEFQYTVTASAQAQVEVTDVVTARGRIGYAFNQFLPYMTAGLALARATSFTTATVSYPAPVYNGAQNPAPAGPGASSSTGTDAKSSFLAYGYALGAGMEVMLMPNVVGRVEYEYVKLTNIDTWLNSARVGLAIKF
jgi:opacity protein-like surface antigen